MRRSALMGEFLQSDAGITACVCMIAESGSSLQFCGNTLRL